ncbi:flavoprotein [Actinoplanes sp. NPDC049118]|uniref:flavoprotein n=1 Tax=Actinoplanes sp. NPDC049118 TaxID=3155769 RepID=UPI0033E89B90
MPKAALVICGAPLARRVGDLADSMVSAGWEIQVVGTPSSASWIDAEVLTNLGVRFDFRTAGQQKSSPTPDVVAVCPATFNTVNKVVGGIADNYATSLICEAIGAGMPVLMAPMVNQKLWGHLQWSASLNALRRANVRLLDPLTGGIDVTPVKSGTGDIVADDFQPSWLLAALGAMLPN